MAQQPRGPEVGRGWMQSVRGPQAEGYMPGPRASLTPACASCLKEVGACENLGKASHQEVFGVWYGFDG